MAFWKKSEDPWDIDPEKKKREAPVNLFEAESDPEDGGNEGTFWDELAGVFKKKPAEEQPEQPPEKCPWCGQDMIKSYLVSGRDTMRLTEKKPSLLLGTLGYDSVDICDADSWGNSKTCWHCKPCRKLVVDVPEQVEYDPLQAWDGNPVAPPTAEELETQE